MNEAHVPDCANGRRRLLASSLALVALILSLLQAASAGTSDDGTPLYLIFGVWFGVGPLLTLAASSVGARRTTLAGAMLTWAAAAAWGLSGEVAAWVIPAAVLCTLSWRLVKRRRLT